MIQLKKLKINKYNHKIETHENDLSNDKHSYKPKTIVFKKLTPLETKIIKDNVPINKKPDIKDYLKNKEYSENQFIEDNLSFEIEKKKLEIISKEIDKNNIKTTYINEAGANVDNLLNVLNNKTKEMEKGQFIEMISFLDDKPKISKIPIDSLNISNLYTKIDDIERNIKSKVLKTEQVSLNNTETTRSKNTDIFPIIEKIEIPEIISIVDDTSIIETANSEFESKESSVETEKSIIPNFIIKDKKLISNPELENKIKEINIRANTINVDLPNKNNIDNTPKIKNAPFEYILPTDYQLKIEQTANPLKKTTSLIYDIEIKTKNFDKKNIHEKYNIDEFTFVDISYNEDTGLYYNIIQPELTKPQLKIYQEIKKQFLDSIDENYYSFKGDKQSINNYIKKVFDITINKLSYDINALEKKLYFSFIKQEFSGLGFCYSILDDKNIIELSCSGADIPINVYHIKYGQIQTNLKFDKLSQLSVFVLSLTKAMGTRVNSTQPIINGYLPNGYKVEGFYSVGDTSNKGSSFIVKKHLEEPLTPVSLMNLGLGIIDLFSYIWCTTDQKNQIIITGEDSTILLNSIVQFYPDKPIISIQSYDNFKFPQKKWVKRIISENSQVSKKTILSQTFLERPEFVILDEFSSELYDSKWYDINLIYINTNQLSDYIDKLKTIGLSAIVIYLDRVKSNNYEQIQITKIDELHKSKIKTIIEFNKDNNSFHINLVSSEINAIEFLDRKKLLRWLCDSEITDFIDFNSIITSYCADKNKLFKKLNIDLKE